MIGSIHYVYQKKKTLLHFLRVLYVCLCVCLGSELDQLFLDAPCYHLPVDSCHHKTILEVVHHAGIYPNIGGCGFWRVVSGVIGCIVLKVWGYR